MSGQDRTTRPGARANEVDGGQSPSLRDLALRRRMIQRKVTAPSPLAGQASALAGAASSPPAQAPAGGGAALPADVRVKMERAFNADFSDVRIHEGPEAAAVGAQAYTEG